MTVVLICGDRHWKNWPIIIREMDKLPSNCTIVHGDATGADHIASVLAEEVYDMKIIPFEAEWTKYGRAAGPIRNRKMFDTSDPDLVLAFHENIEMSKGTKDMMSYAAKRGCSVKLISDH